MEPKIIFQDEVILILDKPSGWIVNNAGTTGSQPVIQSWLDKNFDYSLVKNSDYRSGIVHRLDKETSGLLLVAKTKEAFSVLQQEFKDREVKKTYTTLVHGKVEPKEGNIEVPVGRLPWRRDRFGILPGGRESQTKYKVLSIWYKESKNNKEYFSLVEAFPKTGRTHQIRIHFKYLNHPVVSDEFYAGRKTARNDRLWCPRLFLHASRISFIHPGKNSLIEFKSDLTKDLVDCIKLLQIAN
jgi:23S rRNA pseudouridine1911/1915/1917 synthase